MKEYEYLQDVYNDGYKDGLYNGMSMKNDEIGAGGAAIIVRHDSFKKFDESDFQSYLESEGFKRWTKGHTFDTTWVYVNINSKLYAKGMPGVGVTKILGEHAVTIDEFKTIYNIFKKYERLSVLQMSHEEQEAI